MSHVFPKRLRRHREKRPKLTQPKSTSTSADKPIVTTSGLIAELARPISSRALSEAIEELQRF